MREGYPYLRKILNEDDTFKSPEEIIAQITSSGAELDQYEELVIYFKLSRRASLVWFITTHLTGTQDVFIHDRSWTEWCLIGGFPVE